MIEINRTSDMALCCASCGISEISIIRKYNIEIAKKITICLCEDCLSDFVGVAAITGIRSIHNQGEEK